MSSSYSSSRTSSGSCSCPKKEQEVTLDDVAVVVAGLNCKVLQLRREILSLKDSSGSDRSKGRAGYGGPESVRNKIVSRQPFQGKEDYFPKRRNHLQLISKKSKSRHEGFIRNEADSSSSAPFWSQDVQTDEQRPLSDQDETRNVTFAPRKRRQKLTRASSDSEEFTASDNKLTTGKALSESSSRIHSAKSKDETFRRNSRESRNHKDSNRIKIEKSSSESSDRIHSDNSRNDNSRRIFNERKKYKDSGTVTKRKSLNRYSFFRIHRNTPKNVSPYSISSEGRKRKDTSKTITERSRPDSPKRDDTYVSLRNRRVSRGNRNGRFDVHEMAPSSNKLNHQDLAQSPYRISSDRRKQKDTSKKITEKSRSDSSKRDETYVSLRDRRVSRGVQNGRFDVHEMAPSSDKLNNEYLEKTAYRVSSERRKYKDSSKKYTERSRPDSSKREKMYVSLRNRRVSRGNQNGRFDVHEMAPSSDKLKHEDLAKTVVKHGSNRIVLPSRLSTKCQGIRHAFGLSNAYCNCDPTGSAVRRLRKKKISRGIQCDSPNDNKCRRYCGLGECFRLKCCSKKSRRSRRKNGRKSAKKGESAESWETYMPRKNEPAKETYAIERNDFKQSHTKPAKNLRMGGGSETINIQEFERADIFPPKKIDVFDGVQRHRRRTRWKTEAVADRWVKKNDVIDVKRRLSECLHELNGIIGDVGLIFQEESKQHS